MGSIRFNTSDKKPKLYDLMAIAVVFAAFIAFLIMQGNIEHVKTICIAIIVFLGIAFVRLIMALRGQLKYNPYSYNTIYYIGFAIFVFVLMVFHIVLLVWVLSSLTAFDLEGALSMLLGSAKTYMLFSAPFIFIFSMALFISNIALIRHEGISFTNVLGILLAVVLVAGEILVYKLNFAFSGSLAEVRRHEIITNTIAAIYLYFECMIIGIMITNKICTRYKPDYNMDYIIVLGCGLMEDGSPTPLLRGRIDRAISFYNEQKSATGKEATFVTSGGQGPDEVISESRSMKNYLMEQGIPEENILEENKSTDTYENMQFSRAVIEEDLTKQGIKIEDCNIGFSTTNYHVFRSGIFARRAKMRAIGMGAETKWYFWPNAAVREFIGLVSKHILKQIIILGGMIAAYIAMTLYLYRN